MNLYKYIIELGILDKYGIFERIQIPQQKLLREEIFNDGKDL